MEVDPGVDRVGVREDFRELGGHSILATQLLAAGGKQTGHRSRGSSLLPGPQIEGMARPNEIELRGPSQEGALPSSRNLVADSEVPVGVCPDGSAEAISLGGRAASISEHKDSYLQPKLTCTGLDVGRPVGSQ